MTDSDACREAFEITSKYTSVHGRVVPGTCLPVMFFKRADESMAYLDGMALPYSDDVAFPHKCDSVIHEARADTEYGEIPEDYDVMPEPACRELPQSVFAALDSSVPRPDVLPRGFFIRQTPKTITNYISENRNKRQCKLMWSPNQYFLKMGNGYCKLFGRYVRTTNGAWIYFNMAFLDYCIVFHTKMLNAPGVEFRPLFVPSPPSDGNFWARDPTDNARIMNTVPPVPAGIFIPFGRLPGHLSVRLTKVEKPESADMASCVLDSTHAAPTGTYVLQSKYGGEHPIAKGLSVFPPLEEEGSDPSYQDGGVGFIMYRMNAKEIGFQDESEQPGQPIVLYARCVFGKLALATREQQCEAIYLAIKYALSNAPKSCSGKPFVSLDTQHEGQTPSDFGNIWEIEPNKLEEAVLSGTINAVRTEEQTRYLLARWIRLNNRDASFESALREAQFCVLLAAIPNLQTCKEPVDVCFEGFVRTFEVHEVVHVLEMVDRAYQLTSVWSSVTSVSPVLFHMAPPDIEKFKDKQVIIVGFMIRVHLGIAATRVDSTQTPADLYHMYKTVSDLGTRFIWDMMMFNDQLSVVSTRKETLLSLLTDKAPGELNVHSAKQGLPARTTKTSKCRRIKDPHPALKPFAVDTTDEDLMPRPVAHPPHIDRDDANVNVLLQMIIRGPALSSSIPGSELAIYCPGTKARSTRFAGTCHSWPVHAGFVEKCIMTPRSTEFPWGFFDDSVSKAQRESCMDILYAPLYNSVKGQIWALDGYWRRPEFRRREWETAYGVSVSLMHRAMLFLLYPAFACEYNTPITLDIWELKQSCEAVMQFMSRWGRIIRGVLQNRRRKVRDDVQGVTRNYVAAVGRRVKDAPIANVFLSAYNAFPENLIVGEAPRRCGDIMDPRANPGAVESCDNMFYEEVTTSHVHNNAIPFPDNTDVSLLEFMEEEGEEDETQDDCELKLDDFGSLAFEPCTIASVFPKSMDWNFADLHFASSIGIGSVRPLGSLAMGPETLRMMSEIEAVKHESHL